MTFINIVATGGNFHPLSVADSEPARFWLFQRDSETTLALESPVSLLEMQTVGSHPELPAPTLYLTRPPADSPAHSD